MAKQFAVAPEPNTVLVTYARNDNTSKMDANTKTPTFSTEAGHTYAFACEVAIKIGLNVLALDESDVRMTDKADGRAVVRTRPRPCGRPARVVAEVCGPPMVGRGTSRCRYAIFNYDCSSHRRDGRRRDSGRVAAGECAGGARMTCD